MRGAGRAWVALAIAAAAAPWLAPLAPEAQEDVVGARHLPPLTRGYLVPAQPRAIVVTRLERTGGEIVARRGTRTVTLDPRQVEASRARFYLLGTDGLGRDVASRVAHGLRHSFLVAGLSVLLAASIGVAVGAAAALAGRLADALLMRAVDLVLALPRLVLFLLVATLARPSFTLLVLVLGATGWPQLARLVRGGLQAWRRSELELSAVAGGGSRLRVAVFHLLPQVWPVIAVSAALAFADTVLLESALGFLGLGAPPPRVSLGEIIASGREGFPHAWWVVLFPSALLVALVLGARAIGDRSILSSGRRETNPSP
jgi:ABC-type dipeptide/oligopeptide/nickel transport system permease subunit